MRCLSEFSVLYLFRHSDSLAEPLLLAMSKETPKCVTALQKGVSREGTRCKGSIYENTKLRRDGKGSMSTGIVFASVSTLAY